MNKSSVVFLQIMLVGFTFALLFAIFVVYPVAFGQKRIASIPKVHLIGDVKADKISSFPLENDQYKISYEKRSETYYVFIKGADPATFVENKNKAQLDLKNALILESLCKNNIIISSATGLKVSEEFLQVSNCR